MSFQKSVLQNGVRVITEHHPDSIGVSCGIWIDKGTRDEPKDVVGISHFIEHLVFKGTKTRSAYQIAKSLESVGGDLNAYTTREYTCFHSLSLQNDLGLSLDVLSDLMNNARVTQKDFEREKQVVLQEILMSMDNVEDYIYDTFFEKVYGAHPLARPILGTASSLLPLKVRSVMDYYKGAYAAENMLVSCAGHLDHQEVVQTVEKLFRGVKSFKKPRFEKRTPASLKKVREIISRPVEQVHILVGLPSTSFCGKYRFESYVYNTLLGGGMTSRLYQSVREKRGLVYSIYSQLHAFTDTGICLVYAACEPKNLKTVLKLIYAEIDKLYREGIKENDLEMFRKQVTGSILLGADDVENRMNSLAVNEMVFGEYRSIERVLEEIKQVSVDSVNSYIRKYLNTKSASIVLMGAVNKKDAKGIFASL